MQCERNVPPSAPTSTHPLQSLTLYSREYSSSMESNESNDTSRSLREKLLDVQDLDDGNSGLSSSSSVSSISDSTSTYEDIGSGELDRLLYSAIHAGQDALAVEMDRPQRDDVENPLRRPRTYLGSA
uniref:Uncharacterized protein n=1 Tax=Phaeomonas parva TaxID=124430 RepID=A0A7S1TVC8_9STRA